MRPQGSPAELERRRVRSSKLLQRDVPVHAVADRLGVERRSVRRWKRAYRRRARGGRDSRSGIRWRADATSAPSLPGPLRSFRAVPGIGGRCRLRRSAGQSAPR